MPATAIIGVSLTMPDGSVAELYEGDRVTGLTYESNGETSRVSGAVRVIQAKPSAKIAQAKPTTCPPNPYFANEITPESIILDMSQENNADLITIPLAKIISIDSTLPQAITEDVIVTGAGPQFRQLNDVISDADEGATIYLKAGDYTGDISISKSVVLVGSNEAVIHGKITIGDTPTADGDISATDVKLDGVHLTGDAKIVINRAHEFTMTNCVFEDLSLTQKTMPIQVAGVTPILLKIDGNTFGSQNNFSYNLIDVYGKLRTGSSISNNIFADDSCTHNHISLYGLDTGATVTISNNTVRMSQNLVRIGFKGEPTGTVIMENNTADATIMSDNGAWSGLVFFQPYNHETSSFAGVTLKMNNNTVPDGSQLGYIYAGSNDTHLTEAEYPTVYVNGALTTLPDQSPPAAVPDPEPTGD